MRSEIIRVSTGVRGYDEAGKHAWYLWIVLRDQRDGDAEVFLDHLGTWAERRMDEMGSTELQLPDKGCSDMVLDMTQTPYHFHPSTAASMKGPKYFSWPEQF